MNGQLVELEFGWLFRFKEIKMQIWVFHRRDIGPVIKILAGPWPKGNWRTN